MYINKSEIRLRKCPLCGQEAEIKNSAIVCKWCGLSVDFVGYSNLQDYIDKYWNKQFYDIEVRKGGEQDEIG